MKSTQETDNFLSLATLERFNKYLSRDYTSENKNLADYFNEYIASCNLQIAGIVKNSQLSRNYMY